MNWLVSHRRRHSALSAECDNAPARPLQSFSSVEEMRKKVLFSRALFSKKAREHFGVTELRIGQRELMESVLRGKSALGILPTGAGKSLCYQLPALFLPKATVVVSPLLSLMQDQTTKLEEAGVEALKLDSTLSDSEEREAVREVKSGHAELIYVTPERLENPEYLALLKARGVSLLVVDEAHCVSQWGHDFRPAFLSISRARRSLNNPPVLALTATATPEVENDILTQLDIKNASVFRCSVDRKNLVFEVHRTVNEETKFKKLLEILKANKGNGILYVSTIKLAKEIHSRLLASGIIAGLYHGKMSSRERETFQTDFMHNRYHVMVATKAFGLGIDKPDVRFVVHYTFPDSVESYTQEAGRAGRDGKRALAVLLYRLEDKRVHTYFLGGKYPTQLETAHLYKTLIELTQKNKKPPSLPLLAKSAGLCLTKTRVLIAYLEKKNMVERSRGIRLLQTFPTAEAFEVFLHHYEGRLIRDKLRLEKMMKYGQTSLCRTQFFREYFGEKLGRPCRTCDNCVKERSAQAQHSHCEHSVVIASAAKPSRQVCFAPLGIAMTGSKSQ